MNREWKLPRWVPDVDVIDLHVYGGAALIAVGLALLATWAGPTALGLILMAIGLRKI